MARQYGSVLACALLLACRLENPRFEDESAGEGTTLADTKGEAGEAGEASGSAGDGDGEPETAGDGDGEHETTGDGDGEPETTGDGDGEPETTGDGDGEPETTGDGDGDGDGNEGVCLGVQPVDPCLGCVAEFCCDENAAACLLSEDCACMIKCAALDNDLALCVEDCAPGDDTLFLFETVYDCVVFSCLQECL